MLVCCPFCNKEQEYNSRSTQARKRKPCSCGKKFEIKTDRIKEVIQKKAERIKKPTVTKYDFDVLDNQIADLLVKQKFPGELNQREIARRLNRSPSTISRHLKKIELAQLVKTISIGGQKGYEILIPEPEKIYAMTTHKIQVKCEILSGSINPKQYRTQQMKNWIKKRFTINAVEFEVNSDKSVVFWVTGAGINSNEALNNAKDKGLEIKKYLEQKFSSQLNFPEFKFETGHQNPHFVPVKTTLTNLNSLQKAWNDKSHDGSIETDGKELGDELKDMVPEFRDLKEQVNQIQTNGNNHNGNSEEFQKVMDTLKSEMNNFTSQISNQMNNFTSQITQLTQAIGQFTQQFNNKQPSNNSSPNSYI